VTHSVDYIGNTAKINKKHHMTFTYTNFNNRIVFIERKFKILYILADNIKSLAISRAIWHPCFCFYVSGLAWHGVTWMTPLGLNKDIAKTLKRDRKNNWEKRCSVKFPVRKGNILEKSTFSHDQIYKLDLTQKKEKDLHLLNLNCFIT